jgi:serine/threonine protein kinase
MAAVYKAYEESLDRYVALKVLTAHFLHDPSFAQRFRQEAKVVARLEHPHIVPIHAFGIENGLPWMAMRLIPGGPLSSLLRDRRLTAEEAVPLLRDVAEALHYAHGKGIIHRDVKPHNVLLDEGGRVYLADFGIARMLEGSTHLTATGTVQGTPAYMAPEQATGKEVDARCDVYALGIVAYETLTGRVPFSGTTPMSVLMKHVSEPVPLPPPSEVSATLTAVLHKCLAKEPDDRWPTPVAFAMALERGLQAGGTAPADSVLPTTASITTPGTEEVRTSRRIPAAGVALIAGALIVAAAVILGLVLVTSSGRRGASSSEKPASSAPTPAPVTSPSLAAGPTPKTETSASPAARPRIPGGASLPRPSSSPGALTPAAEERPGSTTSGPVRVFCEARLQREYFDKVKAEEVSDSVRDLKKAIAKKRRMELSDSRERADIVLQVLERGRRPAVVGYRQVRVRLVFAGETFEILGQDSLTGLNTWTGAAGGAAARVEDWVNANYDRVLQRRKS